VFSLFISHYSKENKKIEKYIKDIKSYGIDSFFLDYDDENGIEINEEWEKKIYKAINKSKIVLCFVSKNWIDSCWCQKEYSLAKILGKEIFLLSIEDNEKYKKEVFEWIGSHLQQIDLNENSNNFIKVLKKINKELKEFYDRPYQWDENRNPYPGLESYEEDMAAVFFGRDEEIDEFVEYYNSLKNGILIKPKRNNRCYVQHVEVI